jgi:hypothetical protein
MSAYGRKQPLGWMYAQRLEVTQTGHPGFCVKFECYSPILRELARSSIKCCLAIPAHRHFDK